MNNELPPFEYSLGNICENIESEISKKESVHKCMLAHIHEAAYAMSDFFPKSELFFTSESFINFYSDTTEKMFDSFREYSDSSVTTNLTVHNAFGNSNAFHVNGSLQSAVLHAELADTLTKIFAQKHGFADKENRNNINAEAFLREIISDSGFNAFYSEPIPDYHKIKDTVAYVENIYSAGAFELFRRANPEYKKAVYTDFNTMCENVADGVVGGCILPVRNSESGPLSGFRSLIDDYNLKIVQSCNIMTDLAQDSSAHTEFVLLQKNISYLDVIHSYDIRSDVQQTDFSSQSTFMQSEKKLRLNAKIILSDSFTVGNLMSAAEYLGAKTVEINSLPALYDSAISLNAVFEADIASILSILVFFFLETPQFTPYGIYCPIN